MLGDSAQIEKDIAKKLVLTYRNKVLSEVKVMLANFDLYEPESLHPEAEPFFGGFATMTL